MAESRSFSFEDMCGESVAELRRSFGDRFAGSLELGLARLPVELRLAYLTILVNLVRGATPGWGRHLANLNDRSAERYRTDLRHLERLRERERFCGVRANTIIRMVERLRWYAKLASDESAEEAYAFAIARLIRVVGFLVRAEARIGIVDADGTDDAPAVVHDDVWSPCPARTPTLRPCAALDGPGARIIPFRRRS